MYLTRHDTTRYCTTHTHTHSETHMQAAWLKTDSRGLFENCMLVPAERCSGVSPILTREKGKGKKEGTLLLFRGSFRIILSYVLASRARDSRQN